MTAPTGKPKEMRNFPPADPPRPVNNIYTYLIYNLNQNKKQSMCEYKKKIMKIYIKTIKYYNLLIS